MDESFMALALAQAKIAEAQGEVPIGAVWVNDAHLIEGYNRSITDSDPSAHAEIVTLRQAGQYYHNYRLGGTLYVTLEPCAMCFGAIIQARIKRLVYAANDLKSGAISRLKLHQSSAFNHRIEILQGVLEPQGAVMLKQFFSNKR